MFHANTQRLIDDWRCKRGDRRAPLRADLTPMAFGSLLPQLFMLGSEDGTERFRLSGGLLSELHGGDLRGKDFRSLWSPIDGLQVATALSAARRAGEPVVIDAGAYTAEGDETRLEILLAPLTGPSEALDRTLGLYQPTSSLSRLLGRNITCLAFRGATVASFGRFGGVVGGRPAVRLITLDGRRVA
jgi:hypothetical protein